MRRARTAARLGLLLLGGLAVRVACVSLPLATSAAHDVRGAYHVHSTFSDGYGSVATLAEAAASRELDFVVLTDHNVLHPEAAGIHGGVVIVEGVENSTAFGHLVTLEAKAPLPPASLQKEGDPIGEARREGALPILAHPLNLRNPWQDWPHAASAAGMEVLSYDDLWREALRSPWERGLISGLLELLPNPTLAAMQIVRRPDAALARYDQLRRHSEVALLCAPDAHGVPAYSPFLNLLVMHVPLARPLRPEQGSELARALISGQAFCGLDAIAPTAGFHLEVTPQRIHVTLPKLVPPLPTELKLLRDGEVVATTRDPAYLLDAPPPGDYRVEVSLPLPGVWSPGERVPWILSQNQRVAAAP